MKAIAVHPGVPDSLHLAEIPEPSLDAIPDGRGVRVRVLRAGVCGTDAEIIAGRIGLAPPGAERLVLGHENFGRIVEAGPNVPDTLKPGTLVVASVRRPGSTVYDRIGLQDMTTDELVHERGISLLDGFMTEAYVEDAAFLTPIPEALAEVGVLLEPLSVGEKGIAQAFEIQRRLKVWQPRRAAVLGLGPIGLLAALVLRLRDIEVVGYALRPRPYRNADLIERIGGHYVSSEDQSLAEAADAHGPFDLIFEASGSSRLVFEAAAALGRNGVLVLSSITSGDDTAEIPADAINQGFVSGNKVMVGTINAHRDDFARGVDDMLKAEARYPGWLAALLTTPIRGLERHRELRTALDEKDDAIKIYVEVAPF